MIYRNEGNWYMYGKYEKHVHGSYPLHTVDIDFEYISIHKIIPSRYLTLNSIYIYIYIYVTVEDI